MKEESALIEQAEPQYLEWWAYWRWVEGSWRVKVAKESVLELGLGDRRHGKQEQSKMTSACRFADEISSRAGFKAASEEEIARNGYRN